jgi:hypothetical protein
MSKKAKKPKSPKGGKLPGGSSPRVVLPTYAVDTATALTAYDSYSGEEWVSDVVYDIKSRNYQLWAQAGVPQGKDEITGWWVKWEITDDTIVTTSLITTKSDIPYGAGRYYVERWVDDLDPQATQSLRAGSQRFSINESAYAQRARSVGRAVSAGEALQYYLVNSELYQSTTFPEGGSSSRSFTNIQGDILGGTSFSTSTTDGNWFRMYEGGKFFGKDWYLNPFVENLI